MWRRAHELIEQHTTALAEDLMAMFQDEVLQPYRDRGRRADERHRLAAALSQLKPITVHGRGHGVRPRGQPDDPGTDGRLRMCLRSAERAA